MNDLLQQAWGVIANASGGNWSQESEEWQEAARSWRDRYHEYLAMVPPDHIFPCFWCGLTRDSSRQHGYHFRCWFKARWRLLRHAVSGNNR